MRGEHHRRLARGKPQRRSLSWSKALQLEIGPGPVCFSGSSFVSVNHVKIRLSVGNAQHYLHERKQLRYGQESTHAPGCWGVGGVGGVGGGGLFITNVSCYKSVAEEYSVILQAAAEVCAAAFVKRDVKREKVGGWWCGFTAAGKGGGWRGPSITAT